ncbi:MAG TPA: methyl-accepting chemotaxis protein [Spirochaetota bacterium]|nr:methyl-accepting chemotaxis protein [Spirochaetota bacterium]
MSSKIKGLSGVLFLVLLIFTSLGLGKYAVSILEKNSGDIIKGYSMTSDFLSLIIDHLKWSDKLQNFLHQEGDSSGIQTNHKECRLGKWYYTFINSTEFNNLSPAIKTKIEQIEQPHRKLHESANEIIKFIETGNTAKAADFYSNNTIKHLNTVQTILFEANSQIRSNNNKLTLQKNTANNRMSIMYYAMIIVSFIAVIFITIFLSRMLGLVDKLKPFTEMFGKAALGDLTVRYASKNVNCSEVMKCGKEECPDFKKDGVLCWFDVGSWAPEFGRKVHCPKIINKVYKSCKECKVYKKVNSDEIATLGSWFNKFIESLSDVIGKILIAAENLNGAVDEISSGNQNLSQRTTEQAATLEEIASTVQENSSAISQNAVNSNKAEDLSLNAKNMSDDGVTVADQAVSAIVEINDSSKKIEDIITVINEISFQTNLLALNASVEAARAGDSGRGFAIVAGEVRNLAQRSGTAAKEIAELIKDSRNKVENGTVLVTKSGKALSEINEAVKEMSLLIKNISHASLEQSRAMEQVNTAISGLDSMTQQNSGLVEEIAGASEEMASQSKELSGMLERFKL